MSGDKQTQVLEILKSMRDDEYKATLYSALDKERPPLITRAICKYYSKGGRIMGQRAMEKEDVVEAGNSSSGSSPSTSSLQSAFKAPFIYRGDIVPNDSVVLFDVEKLSLKKNANDVAHEMVASSVAVVDKHRTLMLWSFVGWGSGNICQTFPSITGINKEKLEIGLDIKTVSQFVNLSFMGNKVVGWDLKNDLKALRVCSANCEDLSEYFVDKKNQKYKLKDIAKHFLKKETFQCGSHSAITDARVTRDLYYKMLDLKKEYQDFRKYPHDILRTKESFVPDKKDVCCCPKSTKKNKRKKKTNAAAAKWFSFDDESDDGFEFN